MKRDFLTILDLSSEEIDALLRRASTLKENFKKNKLKPTLEGKTLGLIFNKPSTRTRVSFQVAMYQLGGRVIFPERAFEGYRFGSFSLHRRFGGSHL